MMNSRPNKRKARGPVGKFGIFMMSLMRSRIFLAVVSVMIAVIFWGSLVASDSTLKLPKDFTNVTLKLDQDVLKTRGYVVTDDLDDLPKLNYRVEVSQNSYSRITSDTFLPYIDISEIKSEGTVEAKVAFTYQSMGQIISYEPSTVTLNVERYITKSRVPVKVVLDGTLPDGYYLKDPVTDPQYLTVSGPSSLVNRVRRVDVHVDQSVLGKDDQLTSIDTYDIELVDKDGYALDLDKLKVTNQTINTTSVTVVTELVPMKTVPVDTAGAITGTPAEGYEVTEIIPGKDSCSIAADQAALDSISCLTIAQPLNIDGATEDITGTVTLRIPTDILNKQPSQMTVTVKISEQTKEATFTQIHVDVQGLPDALRATLSNSSIKVVASGPYHYMSTLTKDQIQCYVDVSGLAEGEYQLPIVLHVDNAPDGLTLEPSIEDETVKIQ